MRAGRANSSAVRLVLAFSLIALAFALYRPSLANPLIWDDDVHVARMRTSAVTHRVRARAARLSKAARLAVVLRAVATGDRTTHVRLHGVNVALHGGNAVLLFALLVRMGVPAIAAACGAALWIAHPAAWAAVAYVSGRTDLLAALFTLLALHAAMLLAARPARGATWRESVAALSLLAAVSCAGLVEGKRIARCAARGRALLDGTALGAVRRVDDPRDDRPPSRRARGRHAGTGRCSWRPPALGESATLPLGVRLRAAGAAVATYARLLVVPERVAPRPLHAGGRRSATS
jgi:hypothetical protein